MELDKTLEERGKIYGDYEEKAEFIQQVKGCMRALAGWNNLTPGMKESLDMIQHKVSRILIGSPFHADNWHDIQGYAKLAEDSCKLTDEDKEVLEPFLGFMPNPEEPSKQFVDCVTAAGRISWLLNNYASNTKVVVRGSSIEGARIEEESSVGALIELDLGTIKELSVHIGPVTYVM